MDATVNDVASFFRVLGDATRLAVITQLARSDERAIRLSIAIKQPPETVAAALADLQSTGLVSSRASDAHPNEMYYSLDLEQMQKRFLAAGRLIHPLLVQAITDVEEETVRSAKPRVLFLCTHNSARSQMAEGLLRSFSHGAIEVFSAGSEPGSIHPLAIETMDTMQVDIRNQRSKHFDEFLDQHFDVVITVCDRAREVCPVFPEAKEIIHWSIPDPAAVEGETEQRRAFHQAATTLATRIRYLQILLEREQRERMAMQ
ncbi:MAG: arsenate reductase/protein-tyrosine-phosphatase family protein [Roseiflexus sp.]